MPLGEARPWADNGHMHDQMMMSYLAERSGGDPVGVLGS